MKPASSFAALMLLACLSGGAGAAPAAKAPVTLAGTLAPELARARSIAIDDVWNGFSRAAPIEAHYRLERSADGFRGHAAFSAGRGYPGGPKHADADIAVPQAAADAFLAALGKTMIHAGGYAPARGRSDDYPDLTITIDTGRESVVFASQSQGKERKPWQVRIGAREYVSDSGQPTAALELLQPYLQRDVLDALVERLRH